MNMVNNERGIYNENSKEPIIQGDELKIVHVNINDGGGGATSAICRIDQALTLNKIDSNLLVLNKFTKNKNVFEKKFSLLEKLSYPLSVRLEKFELKRISGRINQTYFNFSTGQFGVDILSEPLIKEANIINLHWINQQFIDLKTIKRLCETGKKIIWTCHDMWPITGGCHYAGRCKKYQKHCSNCPYLQSNKTKDLSYRIFEDKLKYYSKDITIVCPSNWLAEATAKSALFCENRIKVIPNPIDLDLFNGQGEEIYFNLRHIPANKFVICFGAVSPSGDKRKGYAYMMKALRRLYQKREDLREHIHILVFGHSNGEMWKEVPFPVTMLGYITKEKVLAAAYRKSNVCVCPSLSDNLPSVIMESLSCETPVVAFNTGGIPDLVKHKQNGYLADYKNADSLVDGILWVLENNQDNCMGREARRHAENHYSYNHVAKQYMDLYLSL